MSVRELIRDLKDRKISLRLNGETLKVVDPHKNLDPHLLNKLREHKSELIKSLSRSKNFTPTDFPDASIGIDQCFIDKLQAQYAGLEQLYIATPMQKGMIYHGLLDGSGAGYTVQLIGELQGELDQARMQFAWDAVLGRHEIFRTCFVGFEREDIHQLVIDRITMPIISLDWKDTPEELLDSKLRKLCIEDKNAGFDFARPPLMRLTLVQIDANRHFFLWSHHHALLDGWCMGAVIRELLTIYESPHQAPELLSRPEPYSRFIGWLKSRDTDAARAFWRGELAGLEETTQLLLENDDRGGDRKGILVLEGALDELIATKLDAAARQARCTLNVILQAAWSFLLHRYTGKRDIVFGTTVSGRPSELDGVESMIGLFINTVPIRVQVDPDESLGSLLATLNRSHAQREDFSFLSLPEIQGLSPFGAGSSLFDTKLGFANYPDQYHLQTSQQDDGKLRLSNAHGESFSNYGIDIVASRYPEFTISLRYNSSLYSPPSMERLLGHLLKIIAELADAGLDCPLGRIALLTDREQHDLLHVWNQTEADYPRDVCIHQLFDAQCEISPNSPAIVHGAHTLTFREVQLAADRLAEVVVTQGVLPDSPVGLWVDRSPEMVIGLLAILKAGGAYVPLDPGNPDERLSTIAVDCGMTVCVTSKTLAHASPSWLPSGVQLVSIESAYEAGIEGSCVSRSCEPAQLAAIVYTSGSTGRPKGVMLEHRSIINRLAWGWNAIPFSDDERLCQKTTIGFGDSICETLAGLLKGLPLYIVDQSTLLEPGGLEDFINLHHISRLVAVPSLLASMAATPSPGEDSSTLRVCISSGEELTWKTLEDVRRRLPDCRFFNYYGSTETTADACYHEIGERNGQTRVLIGRPIGNATCHVLSPELELMPIGCVGELYVGGECLARGYWKQPDQTSERFIDDPFSSHGRLFRTGDLVRRGEDGALEFVGRADNQIKLRGIRIEPAEIERVLEQHDSVEKAVVTVLNRTSGSLLVAYILLAERVRARLGGEIFGRVNLRDALRSAVTKQLPTYMMPNAFVYLDELPMTPSGKLDFRSLPNPKASDFQSEERRTPMNAIETRLCEIWRQVLGIEELGTNENFFDLGGHSLLATRLVSILRTEFDNDLPLQAIYEYPTIEGLALAIQSIDGQGSDEALKVRRSSLEPILPLRIRGNGTPIFCVHPGSGLSLCYGRLADHLPSDCSVYGLQPACLTSGLPFPKTMEALAAENVELIRSVQPRGPYHLAGFSFGGLAAHAIACALSDSGEKVETLAILDASPDRPAVQSELTDTELIRGILLSVRCDPDELFPNASPTFDDMMELLRERDIIPPGFEDLDEPRLAAMRRGMFAVEAAFKPSIFKGDLLLFEASRGHGPGELSLRWSPYVSGTISLYSVESDHYGMIDPEPMAAVGSVLTDHVLGIQQSSAV